MGIRCIIGVSFPPPPLSLFRACPQMFFFPSRISIGLGGDFFTNQLSFSTAIYKDRNWRMYGLDGKVYGRCFPFPGKEYGKDGGGCGLTFGRREGNRAMRCLTRFTVDDFNAHLPN